MAAKTYYIIIHLFCSTTQRSGQKIDGRGEETGGQFFDFEINEGFDIVSFRRIRTPARGIYLPYRRGMRGITSTKTSLFLASATQIIEYDKSFNILRVINNPLFSDLHDLEIFNNYLYACCSGCDIIAWAKLPDLNKWDFWYAGQDSLLEASMLKPIKRWECKVRDFRKSLKNNCPTFHINSIFRSPHGEIIANLPTKGILYNLSKKEIYKIFSNSLSEKGGCAHNGMYINQDLYMNFTKIGSLGKFDEKEDLYTYICHNPNGYNYKLQADNQINEKYGWLRGMAKHGRYFFLGQMNSQIIVFDFIENKVVKYIDFTNITGDGYAVYGLHVERE